MTDGSEDFRFAEPSREIDYEPYRQTHQVPAWKNARHGFYRKAPPRDYGTRRFSDTDIYYSRAVMEEEWEKIWSKVWMIAGHLNDIPKPNAFMKVDRGPESVLVIRGKGDEVRAFYNVCQHRGVRLVTQDFGSAKKFVCPFHRWEYSSEGKNLFVTDRETFREEALCHDLNLKPVRSEVWRGWVFICFEKDAAPLTEFIGKDFIDRVAPYDMEKAIRIRDVEQVWDANWKVAHEAFIEPYHVQATHPQLVGAVDAYYPQIDLFDHGHAFLITQFMSPCTPYKDQLPEGVNEEHKIFLREAGLKEEDFPAHWQDVPEAIVKAKLARTDYGIDYSKFSEGQLVDDWECGLFPTTELFLHPEGFFVQNWFPHPTDPEKCIYQVQTYAVPGVSELPSYMAVENFDVSGKKVLPRTYAASDDMEILGPVIRQDCELVPRTQQGMKSKGFEGSIYSELEIRIRHWFDEYNRLMGRAAA